MDKSEIFGIVAVVSMLALIIIANAFPVQSGQAPSPPSISNILPSLVSNSQVLEVLSALIIIAGAVYAVVATLLRQAYYKPRISMEITRQRPEGVHFIDHDFYWELSNRGHSPCDNLEITIVPSLRGFPRCQIGIPRLAATDWLIIGFECKFDSPIPKFKRKIAANPFFDLGTVHFGYDQEFTFEWGKNYSIEVSYHFEGSDRAHRKFLLTTGSRDQPVKRFEDVEG